LKFEDVIKWTNSTANFKDSNLTDTIA